MKVPNNNEVHVPCHGSITLHSPSPLSTPIDLPSVTPCPSASHPSSVSVSYSRTSLFPLFIFGFPYLPNLFAQEWVMTSEYCTVVCILPWYQYPYPRPKKQQCERACLPNPPNPYSLFPIPYLPSLSFPRSSHFSVLASCARRMIRGPPYFHFASSWIDNTLCHYDTVSVLGLRRSRVRLDDFTTLRDYDSRVMNLLEPSCPLASLISPHQPQSHLTALLHVVVCTTSHPRKYIEIQTLPSANKRKPHTVRSHAPEPNSQTNHSYRKSEIAMETSSK